MTASTLLSPESDRAFVRQLLVDNVQRAGEARVEDPMRRFNIEVATILLRGRNGACLDGFISGFVDAFGEEEGIDRARQWWLDLSIGLGQL